MFFGWTGCVNDCDFIRNLIRTRVAAYLSEVDDEGVDFEFLDVRI